MPKHAQSSVEFLMVAAILTVILIPTVFLFYDYARSSTKQIDTARITQIGTLISETCEDVNILGPPSKRTLRVSMPDGIEDMKLICKQSSNYCELSILYFKSKYNFPFNVHVDNGKCPDTPLEIYECLFDKQFYSAGEKKISLQAEGDKIKMSFS